MYIYIYIYRVHPQPLPHSSNEVSHLYYVGFRGEPLVDLSLVGSRLTNADGTHLWG